MPAVVDLACMRDAMNRLKSDPNKINPLVSCFLNSGHKHVSYFLYMSLSLSFFLKVLTVAIVFLLLLSHLTTCCVISLFCYAEKVRSSSFWKACFYIPDHKKCHT